MLLTRYQKEKCTEIFSVYSVNQPSGRLQGRLLTYLESSPQVIATLALKKVIGTCDQRIN